MKKMIVLGLLLCSALSFAKTKEPYCESLAMGNGRDMCPLLYTTLEDKVHIDESKIDPIGFSFVSEKPQMKLRAHCLERSPQKECLRFGLVITKDGVNYQVTNELNNTPKSVLTIKALDQRSQEMLRKYKKKIRRNYLHHDDSVFREPFFFSWQVTAMVAFGFAPALLVLPITAAIDTALLPGNAIYHTVYGVKNKKNFKHLENMIKGEVVEVKLKYKKLIGLLESLHPYYFNPPKEIWINGLVLREAADHDDLFE